MKKPLFTRPTSSGQIKAYVDVVKITCGILQSAEIEVKISRYFLHQIFSEYWCSTRGNKEEFYKTQKIYPKRSCT